jgi:succinyl-CoA synthetase alpha subunit
MPFLYTRVLGGDNLEEVLLKGSVAILSNSGGFTTTIAQYLGTEGWGTTTLVSSGKDVYIHYAARDFAHAFNNYTRSKAAVLYTDPGGYYERGVEFGKPVVACVVGRWKSKLTRAVGHAGAMELGRFVEYYPTGTAITLKGFAQGQRWMIAGILEWDMKPRAQSVIPPDSIR